MAYSPLINHLRYLAHVPPCVSLQSVTQTNKPTIKPTNKPNNHSSNQQKKTNIINQAFPAAGLAWMAAQIHFGNTMFHVNKDGQYNQ